MKTRVGKVAGKAVLVGFAMVWALTAGVPMASAANGPVAPPQIDITNGTMSLNSGAAGQIQSDITKWLMLAAILIILGIGVNMANHAYKMSHGDERTRSDGMKGILHSILAIVIVAALWLIISAIIGMV
ncbi:MAG: hypothetical protein M0Z41_08500 [Peptococcaceae bacterium]|jgi:hypothetical protein|nr:hypothetical protein [Peptococcaceae bacterium]